MTITKIHEDTEGNLYIYLPIDILTHAGLFEGDQLTWVDNEDGSFTVKKVKKEKKEYVLVDCIQQYRTRYVVKVPKGETDWALDTVTCHEAEQFSQQDLGETIVSHRVVSEDEVLSLCNKDNSYCQSWSNEKKLEVFVTVVDSDGTVTSFIKG